MTQQTAWSTYVAVVPERPDDLAIVRAVIRREPGAFERMRSHVGGVVTSCLARALRRWPHIRSHREDLLQSFDLFLVENDYRTLETYSGRAALTTWMHSVALRFFYRQARRLDRTVHTAYDERAAAEVPDDALDPEKKTVVGAQIEGVREVVQKLPATERTLLKLLYEQEASAQVVGDLLGISGAGVRMKKKRLLERLAEQLEELWL